MSYHTIFEITDDDLKEFENRVPIDARGNFGTFTTRSRPSGEAVEVQVDDKEVFGEDDEGRGPGRDIVQDVGDVGEWVGDVWQNVFSGVPEEESGVSNEGAPAQMQTDLAHVPADSTHYAIKVALSRYYKDAADSGHAFDVYQDDNSGKYVYTDPNTMKPTWIEPPGIEWGDWADDGALMAYEMGASSIGAIGGFLVGGPPGAVVGASTLSGLTTGVYTASELYDLLEKGYLNPEIYGTADNPNDSAIAGESSKQGGLSMAGSVIGDTFVWGGTKAFRRMAQTKPFKSVFPKTSERLFIDDSIVKAVKLQKKGGLFKVADNGVYRRLSDEDFSKQTTAGVLKTLARRQRIGLWDRMTGASAAEIAVTGEKQAAGKSTQQFPDYSEMTPEDARRLEEMYLGGELSPTDAKAYEEIEQLNAAASRMEVFEATAANQKSTSAQLQKKFYERAEHVRKRYELLLTNSGIDKEIARKLGQQFERNYSRDIHKYVVGAHTARIDAFPNDVQQTSRDLAELLDGMLSHAGDPDKLGKKIQSMLGLSEGIFDNMVSKQYLDIFDGEMPNFPLDDLLAGGSSVNKWIDKLDNNLVNFSDSSIPFIEKFKANLVHPKGSTLEGEFKTINYEALDDTLKSLRSLKRDIFASNKDRVNRKLILDVESDLLALRTKVLEEASGGGDRLKLIQETERLVRDGRETFDRGLIGKLLSTDTPTHQLFNILTNAGSADIGYIKGLLENYVGTSVSKKGPKPLSKLDTNSGQDLYNAMKDAFYTDYWDKVVKQELDLGEGADILGIPREFSASGKAAHVRWAKRNMKYVEQWLDPEDVVMFNDAGFLSNTILKEKRALQQLQKQTGIKDQVGIFNATYGPTAVRYDKTHEIYSLLHDGDTGAVNKGAEAIVDKYKALIFHDMQKAVLAPNPKTDPNMLGDVVVKHLEFESYVNSRRDSMALWLGADAMKEVDDVVELSRMAQVWRTNRPDDSGNKISNVLNDVARAYVGMFTRPGRMLTAGKRLHQRSAEIGTVEKLLDAELSAKRITYGEVSLFKRLVRQMYARQGINFIGNEPQEGAEPIVLDFSDTDLEEFQQGYKDGGVVHDYQLPTLNRPDSAR